VASAAGAAGCGARPPPLPPHRIALPATDSVRPVFVDVHSHVVPSGDDGARSVEAGLEICRSAAQRGTRVLFAPPHVWPMLPLTPEREEDIRFAHAEMAPAAARFGLDLQLGF